MDHGTHVAGTIPECPGCLEAAYEPGWYSLLRRLSERPEDQELLSLQGGSNADAAAD
jgi:hypothetical protein